MAFSLFTTQSSTETFQTLESRSAGLSEAEVTARQKKYGFNEAKVRHANALDILLRQLQSPFCYLLVIAAIISFFIGDRSESIAFLVFVGVNLTIGFLEYRAEHSVALLQNFIPEKAAVIREGKQRWIDKKLLVPGDIISLKTGDIAPADARIFAADSASADESSLTGESLPVAKTERPLPKQAAEVFQAANIVFAGTSLISGKLTAVVVATGKQTILGGIETSLSVARQPSAYEKSILYFSKLILRIVALTITIIFAVNLLLKGFSSLFEISLFSLALIVSILPDALPAVVTFALSEGSLKLAKQNVVVKRLSAIEDLGNIEILCTDKTGTITENKMTLEKIVGSDKQKLFLYGLLSVPAASAQETSDAPFDNALSQKAPRETEAALKKWKLSAEVPFDSYRMRSAFLLDSGREKIIIVKGAPESLLKVSTRFAGRFKKQEILEDVSREGKEGKRVLALAYKKVPKSKEDLKASDEKGLTFLGYFVFDDPLKSSAKESIELAKKVGLSIKVITGDSLEVAEFCAKKIGLPHGEEDVVSSDQLAKLPREAFDDVCQNASIFARVSPDMKQKIIGSLQKKFEVGFMGDGINDAPALKKADVGIAVKGASDVAREAADVVLLDRNLDVVINGVKVGREIFANVNKYIKTTLANNFGNFYSISIISLFINFLPMLPVQILLGDILSDLPLISIATDSVDVEELQKPKAYQLHNVLPLIVSLGLTSTLFDFIFYAFIHTQKIPVIQTLWFVETILTQIFLIFVARTAKQFWKAKRPSNLLLTLTAIIGLVIIVLPFLSFAQSWFHFVTPPILPLLGVFVIVIFYTAASEAVKLIYFKYFRQNAGH